MKQLAWLTVIIQSLLIVASRKHYTVDVVVAWYTVNLVVFFIDKKLPGWHFLHIHRICIVCFHPISCVCKFEPDPDVIRAELPDRSSASAALFLPLTKDNKTKEENHKLLNGNSGDAADWV